MEPVPQEWIKGYVDQMLRAAAMFPDGSPMRDAAMLRADHAMDLVKAFRRNLFRHRSDTRSDALLRVAAVQLERLDAADRECARPYVERLIAAAERDLTKMEAGE